MPHPHPTARLAFTILVATAVVSLAGCVRRTITLNSDPAGAIAYLNNEEVGRTPTTVPFTFYGTYDVRLEKDGYQTLETAAKVEAPFWDSIGPDLIAELAPGTQHVDINLDFQLEPATPPDQVDTAPIIDRAKQLRAKLRRGQ